MTEFQKKLLTRFVTSCRAAFCLKEAHSCILAGNHIANARRARQPIRSRSAHDRGAPPPATGNGPHREEVPGLTLNVFTAQQPEQGGNPDGVCPQ